MAREKNTSEKKTGVAAWNESAGISSRSSASDKNRGGRAVAERRRRTVSLVVLAILCACCIGLAWPIKDTINRGLYLKGGTAYTMEVATSDGGEPSADDMSSVVSEINSRLAASGISEYAVSHTGGDTVEIDLPQSDSSEGVAQIVGGAGLVEFVRVDEIGDAEALVKINAGTENVPLQRGTYTSFLDGSSVSKASVEDVGSGNYAVHIVFDEEGAKTFADVTRGLAEDYGRIAIVIDGKVNSAPSVSEEISGGEVYITGDFSKEEAEALKAVLDGETLQMQITYIGSSKVDALVGKALLWVLVGASCVVFVLAAVLAYRSFHKLSLLVAGAMAIYAVLMLGIMALASRLDMFVLTIPGVIGGALFAVGTVIASWLIAKCFQDKVSQGHSVKGAALSAPREALRPLAYPCAGVSLVAVVMLFLPMAAMREFGLTVVFGVICAIFAVGWYAITLLRLLAMGKIQADPAAWGVTSQTAHAKTDDKAS